MHACGGSRPAAPGRAAGWPRWRAGRPAGSRSRSRGGRRCSRTACHHFLPSTVLIVSRSVSQPRSRPVSGGRRPRVTQFRRRLRGAAERGQRPVRSRRMTTPKTGEQDEPGDAEQGGVDRGSGLTGAPASMAGSAKMGSASSPPTPSSEKAVRPPDGGVGVEPGGGEHAELDGGAGRVAAGQAVGDCVAGQPGGDDGEPALGAQRQPLQGEVAGEVRPLRRRARQLNQIGLSVDRRGHEPSTAASFGSTR